MFAAVLMYRQGVYAIDITDDELDEMIKHTKDNNLQMLVRMSDGKVSLSFVPEDGAVIN